ncbi:uncharacterized protein LOC101240594 isoform X1 [Hydra vulgaris]|uniref:uncharacterized protein LOC101240594 isoform X1 n=1 Tax=Hydra vulgaris TaxID=6087 RepID=UPI000641779F|nr:uncharacterized protein LOC101240594 [Hydra vulgaris]
MNAIILFLFLEYTFLTKSVSPTLDVRLNGLDLKSLLMGSNDYIKIVDKGQLSSIIQLLQSNFTKQLPAIQPELQQLRFQFQSGIKLYYSLKLLSSDVTIMKTPTVNIPLMGRLETSWIDFEVRFPCTESLTGVVILELIMDFFIDEKRTELYKRINLSMNRNCRRDIVSTLPSLTSTTSTYAGNICEKQCDMNNFKRMYCLSDFVARLKITEVNLNNSDGHYVAHVTKQKIFRHPTFLKISKRNQRIESFSLSLTCECKPLEIGKRYLLFGREDVNQNLLFVNKYSLAFELSENIGLYKEFLQSYKTIKCPPYLMRWFNNRNSKWFA